METPEHSDTGAKHANVVPETEQVPAADEDTAAEDEAAVWQSFEQSVEYMRNLSALYKDAFLAATGKTAAPTVTRINAAKEHAREALELLASNLLNASTAIVATMENQEEQLAAVDAKLDRVKWKLREREETREREIVRQFFDLGGDPPVTRSNDENGSHEIRGSLRLTLAGPALPTTSARQSSYLYL